MPARRIAKAVPSYTAQLATLVESAPRGDEWLHEQNFDGYRIGIRIEEGQVRLWSRRGQDWTAEFLAVAQAAGRLGPRSALLDGEVAVVLPSGITSFQALQNRRADTSFTYFAFDLRFLDGEGLRDPSARAQEGQTATPRGRGGGWNPSLLRPRHRQWAGVSRRSVPHRPRRERLQATRFEVPGR